MQCPHCLIGIRETWKKDPFHNDTSEYWGTTKMKYPECKRLILSVYGYKNDGTKIFESMVYPKQVSRSQIPSSVTKEFADDYSESCLVLSDSAKASAALSRRCLQNILRKKAGIKGKDLHAEIEKAIESKIFPAHILEVLDAIRNFGNFSTHPIEDKQTGAIIDVEEGEAEWLLDIIEELFDFYYVQPERVQKRKKALNDKLAKAGKPPMKEPKK